MDSRMIAVKRFLRLPIDRKVKATGLGFLRLVVWVLWDFTGLHLIYRKIFPNRRNPEKKYPTFFIWVVGIYFATYGIAAQRYESKVDLIENRTNFVIALSGTSNYKIALEQIPMIQNMKTPWKPSINPVGLDTLKSFFGDDVKCKDYFEPCIKVNIYLKKILLSYLSKTTKYKRPFHLKEVNNERINLDRINLSEVDLSPLEMKGQETNIIVYTNLFDINLRSAHLRHSDLRGVYFIGADLSGSWLNKSDLGYAMLNNSNLKEVDFTGADLKKADLEGAKIIGARFHHADLSGATWVNGKKCGEGSIGKCIYTDGSGTSFDDKSRYK